ncbi:MoaD/ThiS family protein [Novipirellula artificiosorum]|uniref:Molybdopterin synthase sulfur carrier subunit n=1 Tax=Novipirellula artificiosorum TaxID=2528016 RepID=A0A5C6DTN0_9BACT|nr:MoaD/ThiS family protein [Novipirellula artificiosorum]TWU39237.1 ThiS family protein [Novipirellula artificiosorum]
MKFNVLLFAAVREAADADAIAIELNDDATAKDVLEEVAQRLPSVSGLLPACRVALDSRYVAPDTAVAAATEIAIIPPVSGG